MKKLFLLFPLLLLVFSLTGCAGQTAQQTTGKTLLAMHDLVAVSATTADALCKQKVIATDSCGKVKVSYDSFRVAWPIVDDALIVYLRAPATDAAAATTFNVANTIFIKNYTELMTLFTTTGVLKGGK